MYKIKKKYKSKNLIFHIQFLGKTVYEIYIFYFLIYHNFSIHF